MYIYIQYVYVCRISCVEVLYVHYINMYIIVELVEKC